MNALVLFAGAGGADIGLRSAGFDHLACVEGDEKACATLRAAGFPAVHAWIGDGPQPERTVRGRVQPPLPVWRHDGQPVDLLWASPPCQPYSRAGSRLGADDARDGWPATLAAIREVRPVWVVIENVVGSPASGWADALRPLYPEVTVWRADAVDWGLPSHRDRLYIVAGPRRWTPPAPTHYGPRVPWLLRAGRSPWVSFGEALGLVDVIAKEDRGAGMTERHGARPIIPGDMPLNGVRCGGQGGYLLLPSASVMTTEVKGTRASAASGFTFNGGPDRASDSLFLATGRRRLTWQECATLVGFPDGYPFQGTIEARYRQVGNAIAPIMAEALARSLPTGVP